jgi:large subunit ribosomal protein L30
MAKQLRITWVRSAIRRKRNQKVTLDHLGLRRLNQSVLQPDNPQIRGMVRVVEHLVTTEEVEA